MIYLISRIVSLTNDMGGRGKAVKRLVKRRSRFRRRLSVGRARPRAFAFVYTRQPVFLNSRPAYVGKRAQCALSVRIRPYLVKPLEQNGN